MTKKKTLFETYFKNELVSGTKKRISRKLNESDALEAGLRDEEINDDSLKNDEISLERAMSDEQVESYDHEEATEKNKKIQKAIEEQKNQADDLILSFIDRIDEFVAFMNDPENPNSIHSIVSSAFPGTTLDKITGSDLRRIIKVAADASALSQTLRAYIGGKDEFTKK